MEEEVKRAEEVACQVWGGQREQAVVKWLARHQPMEAMAHINARAESKQPKCLETYD